MSPRRREVPRAVRSCSVGLVASLALGSAMAAFPASSVAGPVPHPARSGPAETAATVVVPTTPTVREFRLPELAEKSRAVAATSARTLGSTRTLVAAPRPVAGYGVVGATWEGRRPAGLSFAVRTRVADGRWSGWQTLHGGDCPCADCAAKRAAESLGGHGPDAGTPEFENARPGTDALVVGDVDAVQLRVSSRRGVVPTDLTLSVVDPGRTRTAPATDAAREVGPSRAVSAPRTAVAAADVTAPKPTILTRAQWGADERMRTGKPSYGTIKAAFVHHTVNANDYTRAEVPGIIRGIYAYHTQSRGWSDIGYNFLVDRFGRIWEGRYGGVARPVIGAHTYGYNHLAFAMSAIGNFDVTEPSKAMLDAYGRLFAWKLSLHDIKAKSTVYLDGKKFPAINGHRDVGQTACPGRYLYAKLPGIRTRAADIQAGGTTTAPSPSPSPTPSPTASPTPTPPTPTPEPVVRGAHVARDLEGDGRADLLVRDRSTGSMQALRGDRGPGFQPARELAIPGRRIDLFTGVGDVTGDGRPDVVTRVRRTGVTQLRPGRPTGFAAPVNAVDTTKFRGTDLLAGAGNVVGTRWPDLLARDTATKQLWVYPGRSGGRWGSRQLVWKSASGVRTVAGVHDVNGDTRRDIVVTTAKKLLVLRGLGSGRFASPVTLSSDWQRDLTVVGQDLTGDGAPDLLARLRATGRTAVHAVESDGRPGPQLGSWATWSGLKQITAVGDPGTGTTRLLARTGDDTMVLLDSLGTGWFAPTIDTGRLMADADFVQVAGDWTGDSHPDVIARSASTGNLWLYPGTGAGDLGSRTRIGRDWGNRRDLVVSEDLTGDGRPDLLARDPDGAFYVYPSDGAGGRGTRALAKSALFAIDRITPVGYWNGDNYRDLVVRRATTKELFLLPGGANGRLGQPVRLTGGFAGYDRVLGVGDFDHNGTPDLVATDVATGRLWLMPGRSTGLGAPRYLAPDLSRFDRIG